MYSRWDWAQLLAKGFISHVKNLFYVFSLTQLSGVILANPGITGLLLINEYFHFLLKNYSIDMQFAILPLAMVLSILIGMVSGAEVSIFSKLIERKKWHASKPIISFFTSDYFGAFAGILMFTFLLNPFVGLIKSIVLCQLITLCCINFIYFRTNLFLKQKPFSLTLLFIDFYFILFFIFQNQFIIILDSISGF